MGVHPDLRPIRMGTDGASQGSRDASSKSLAPEVIAPNDCVFVVLRGMC
jgi:hypothetical protein